MTSDDTNPTESVADVDVSADPEVVVEAPEVEEYRDVLPSDLQPGLADHDDYMFPNNNRRKFPAYLYLAIAAVLLIIVGVRGQGVLINNGIIGGALVLAFFGLYHLASGQNLAIDERDALIASIADVGFPVGHASAQMGWRGWLSRPTWRILIYSAENPPLKRGLVLVDGVDGRVVETLIEDNPEDWSEITDDE